MKIAKLLILTVFVFSIQSVSAIRIAIKNLGNSDVGVCPDYTGVMRNWDTTVSANTTTDDQAIRFNSGIHTLRKLYVLYEGVGCFEYNFGPKGFSGTGKITIEVNPKRIQLPSNPPAQASSLPIRVSGHTDVLFQEKTKIGPRIIQAEPTSCNIGQDVLRQ